jgi:phosphate transport system substrate-binding protein
MAEKVKADTGSIGYVELQYAMKGNISQAAVQNPAGKFAKASAQSINAACEAIEKPRWNRFSVSLIDAPAADAFPITSFTWIYLRTTSADSARATALRDFLNWIYTDGQQFAVQEGYSELPPRLLATVRKRIKDLQ